MGAFLAGLGAAAISAAPQIVNMASSLISSGRADYWHNRDQEHLDKRQDNEIQRRVADAKAAGINPYDAIGAGSGASSSTIAHSGAGGLDLGEFNPGAYLDFQVAKEQVKQQKEKTKQEQDMSSIINFQKAMASRQDFEDKMRFKFMTGADQFYSNINNDYGFSWHYNKSDYANDNEYFANSPYMKQLALGYRNFVNQSDMLQTDKNWYDANMLLNAINSGTGSVGNIAGAFSSGFGAYRNFEGGKYFRAQRNYFEPEFTYPKHEMGFHP